MHSAWQGQSQAVAVTAGAPQSWTVHDSDDNFLYGQFSSLYP